MDGISALLIGFGAGCFTGAVYRLWSRYRRDRDAGRKGELQSDSR